MRLVYIDDAKADGQSCFAGLMISAARWRDAVGTWQAMLEQLRHRRGFRTTRELHATKLLSGHGNYFDTRPRLAECVETHVDVLRTIVSLPSVRLFLASSPVDRELPLFERLITCVNRTMEAHDDHAILICDNGKTYDDLMNRLRHTNIVHGPFGVADRPLTRLVEDIVYRDSKRSVLIQAADACVYTLLRQEKPLPRLEAEHFGRAFQQFAPIVVREAAPDDVDGVIRDT